MKSLQEFIGLETVPGNRAGFSPLFVLSAVFACLVSSCDFPRFFPTDLYIQITSPYETEIYLTYRPPNYIGMATITATMRPSVAIRGAAVIWEWETSDENVVDFFDALTVHERESSTVKVVAWHPGTAIVTVRARVGGTLLDDYDYIKITVGVEIQAARADTSKQ